MVVEVLLYPLMLAQRRLAKMSLGETMVKYLEGGQHLSKGKERHCLTPEVLYYIIMLSIDNEMLLLRCEPYFPPFCQSSCLQRNQERKCIFTIGWLITVLLTLFFFFFFLFCFFVFFPNQRFLSTER